VNQIISLIDPTVCNGCRFSASESIPQANGTVRLIMRCKRKDCDNWIMSQFRQPRLPIDVSLLADYKEED
jgi:hypothetical protein